MAKPKPGSAETEKELVKATSVKRKEGEKDSKYCKRLTTAAGELPDKAWAALSDEAQSWVNGNVELINADGEPVGFEGAEPDEDEAPAKPARVKPKVADDDDEDEAPAKPAAAAPDDDDDDDDEDEAPAKPARVKPKVADDDDEDEAPAKPATANTPGIRGIIEGIICKHPAWDREKIGAYLEKKGLVAHPDIISGQFYSVRKIIRLLTEAGWAPPAK